MLLWSGCNWRQRFLQTSRKLLPRVHLLWGICAVPMLQIVSGTNHPSFPLLCFCMEICWHPQRLIINTSLLFQPPLKLGLCTKPMNTINWNSGLANYFQEHLPILTFMHPCAMFMDTISEGPNPWKLTVALSDLRCIDNSCSDTKVCNM